MFQEHASDERDTLTTPCTTMAASKSQKRSSLLVQFRSFFNQFLKHQSDSKSPSAATPQTMAADQPPSIAILGAGIGGLGLAIGLIKRGVPVTVYESAKEFSMIGAGIGFGPNSLDAIDLIDTRFRAEYERAKVSFLSFLVFLLLFPPHLWADLRFLCNVNLEDLVLTLRPHIDRQREARVRELRF